MCVIAVKERGIELPKESVLETCFDNNSDGAGFMYIKDGSVRIEKGFETFEELIVRLEAIKFTPEDMVVYHFRIATDGGVSPGNTHPFPIVKKKKHLKSTRFETKIALAHNGRIDIQIKGNDMSDTQEFVRSILFKNKGKLISDEEVHKEMLKMGGSSKFCILTPEDHKLLGTGWVEDDEGMKFSNSSYKKRIFTSTVTQCGVCHKWPTYCTCVSLYNCPDCNRRYADCICFVMCNKCKKYGDMCICKIDTVESVMMDCLDAVFEDVAELLPGNIDVFDETMCSGYVTALDDMTRIAEERLIPKDTVKEPCCDKCGKDIEYGFVKSGKLYCYPCNRTMSNYGGGY